MMLAFYDKLNHVRRTPAGHRESGAALVFAVIVMMVMLLTVTLVTVSAITASSTTSAQSVDQLKREAAETAIQSALQAANGETNVTTQSIFERSYYSGGWFNGDLRNIVAGEPAIDARYRWRAEPVVEYGGRLSWYIYAQGYVAGDVENAHEKQALFRGYQVESGGANSTSTSGVTYNTDPVNPWQLAPLFGERRVTFNAGVTVASYDSWNGFNPQLQADARGVVGSNGRFNLGTGTGVFPAGLKEISVAQYVPGTGTDASCNGPASECSKVRSRGFNYENTPIASVLGAACPATTYPAWTSSTNASVLNLTGTAPRCFSSMTFNTNTTVLGTAPVYVTGNVIVNSGVKVNVGNDPSSLRIFSDIGNFTVGGTTTSLDTATHANLYYATNFGTCTFAGTFSGAASCELVWAQTNARLYLDAAAGTKFIDRNRSAASNVWFEITSERR